jgi:hypothetical protein
MTKRIWIALNESIVRIIPIIKYENKFILKSILSESYQQMLLQLVKIYYELDFDDNYIDSL